jgi:DNA ligase (NAD+)
MPTVLRSVVFDVGRTGKITPVAEVDPVDIGGVTVSRATLHNVFDIRRRNVRINDEVVIYRSGDTIPEIGYRSKALSRYVYRPNIRLPKTCPACGGALIREKGEINTYCVSPFCAGRNKALLRYFVSKDGMDIQGFGPALVNRLYDAQLIGSYNDIFNLDKETLVHFGVPAVMAEKIVEQIELALRKEDWRFLSSIGIRRVGRATAKQICRLFKLEDLPTLTLDQWRQIPDVDEKTAQYLFAYFQSSGNVSSFKAMDWWAGARFLNTQVDPFRKLYNKSVVFSGSFKPPHRREFLETVVGVEGGLVSKEVTKNTNALVVGDNPTPRKLEKAKELNIPVWSSVEFLQFTGEAPY